MVLTSTVQACTGIEDLGIAIMHLEEANWVLVVSKQKVGFDCFYTKNIHREIIISSIFS